MERVALGNYPLEIFIGFVVIAAIAFWGYGYYMRKTKKYRK